MVRSIFSKAAVFSMQTSLSFLVSSLLMADETPISRPTNRLARESSPYLLLHAHNPVDWYPWGPEAFEKARSENKPIFLSIGYSSCYWCHVMERETFMNQKVADLLNQHFVSIKVDREERPDVDDIYMTSLIVYNQAAGRGSGGGWPLTLFLTPAGEPIAGATYLPPENTADGRTGFLTAASRIQELWKTERESMEGTSSMIAREVRRISGPGVLAEPQALSVDLISGAVSDLKSRYDQTFGGVDFNSRNPEGPRFPSVPRLMFLQDQATKLNDPELQKIVDHSLTAMALGGIRDHLGGGFHRYSTDRRWQIPHFEKMLYDQAQLLEVYARANQRQPNELYSEVIAELVEFLKREMTLPGGGFCSALDAETNAIEGEYYVWSEEEIREALSAEDAEIFLTCFGFHEEQDFEHGRVLVCPADRSKTAETLKLTPEELQAKLAAMKSVLLNIRGKRPRPLLDDKVLAEWNALMIQALAISGQLPGREQDLQLASRSADFLLTKMKNVQGQILRSWRNEVVGPRAYLDDYACLISALRHLHEATHEERWLTAAQKLMEQQIVQFYDEAQSTFFFTAHDQEKLFARSSSPFDSVSPSGNSLTIRNLLALRNDGENATYLPLAEKLLNRFSGTLQSSPASCSGLAMALDDYLQVKAQAVIANSTAEVVTDSDSVNAAIADTSISDTRAHDVKDQTPVPADSADEHQTFKPVPTEPSTVNPLKRNSEERRVKAKIFPYFDKLPRGGKCPVAIELMIAKNWHINANPASPDFLIPTEIKVTSMQKVKMTRVKYPKHELLTMEGQDEPSHVYGKTVTVFAMLEIDAAEMADKAELEVEIRFQACNEKSCEAPDVLRLKGRLPLATDEAEIKRINEDKFPRDDEKSDGQKSDDEKSKDGKI
jgi:uncharacterized protein YyaL (SSP411 family)